MKNKLFIAIGLLVLVVVLFIINNRPIAEAPALQSEGLSAAAVQISPVEHASFVMKLAGVNIFNDPVGDAADYEKFGMPDLILLSDIHGDHFNLELLQAITASNTILVAPQVVINELTPALVEQAVLMNNGDAYDLLGLKIEAVPMYNLPEAEDAFHAKGRGNGYLLTGAEQIIYIAGDTSDIPEMRALENIDIAFIPMNLPYTMTVEAAADAVLEFAPKNVYPYHFRGTGGLSDVENFKALVNAGNPEINVSILDWYPETE